MMCYVAEVLICFQHNAPKKPQDQLHAYIKPKYGEKVNYSEEKYSSPLLVKYGKTFIQEFTVPSYIAHGKLIAQCYQRYDP